jgi:hypothetical protein
MGIVRLAGVASAAARALAGAVATSAPTVRAIVNELAGPGGPPRPARVLLPRIGLRVYATDGELGRLDRVVLSPRTQRVTHLIVASHLPNPGADAPHDWDACWGPRTVVIPAAAVGTATACPVVLGLDLARASRRPRRADSAGAAQPPDRRDLPRAGVSPPSPGQRAPSAVTRAAPSLPAAPFMRRSCPSPDLHGSLVDSASCPCHGAGGRSRLLKGSMLHVGRADEAGGQEGRKGGGEVTTFPGTISLEP